VHFDTTSPSVYGSYQIEESRDVPFTLTSGHSKAKRPDLKQFVLSTLCVDRAVPIWGQPEDGNASDKALKTTILSEISHLMARYGVAPGAYISIAASAMATETHLDTLGETLFISRFPATYSECARVIEDAVTLYDKTSRAVVVHSRSQDKRRQKRLAREVKASLTTLEAAAREAAKQTYVCQADAAVAADQRRALASEYHRVEVEVDERPTYAPGRPSATTPRTVKALHYGLKVSLPEKPEVMARKRQEAGCFVLLSTVPSVGEMAHSAQEVLSAYKEPHGIEQHYGFLKDPLMVNSLFLDYHHRLRNRPESPVKQ
jgi:transposase